MIEQLKESATEGLVVGVKWAVVIVIIAMALSMFMGDYMVVRERSLNGQKAYEWIAVQQQQQQKAVETPK